MSRVRERHRLFPWLTFRLLVRPAETVARIKELCPELRDPWTQSFVAYYGIDRMTSSIALGELMLIVMFIRANTVKLENGNASVKHTLDVMSTHVEAPQLARVSADRCLARVRARTRRRRAPRGTKRLPKQRVGRKAKQEMEKQRARGILPKEPGRRRRGGGGAWRAFVGQQRRGKVGERTADMQALSRQYRALSAEAKAALAAEGLAATVRHREGGSAFQKRAIEVEREIDRDRKRRRAEALAQGAIVPVRPVEDTTLEDLPGILETLKADNRSVNDIHREEDHAVAVSLTSFRNTEGVHVRDQLVYAVPALAPLAPQLTGEAKAAGVSHVSWTYSASDLPRAQAFLSNQPNIVQDCIEHWEDTLHKLVLH